MNGYVLDASVAAKWFLADEPFAAKAIALLDAHTDGRLRFIAPDFFWLELGNVLWKASRQGRITRGEATESLGNVTQRASIRTASSLSLREHALLIALDHNRSVYDSSYLALAATSGLPMITADERLVRALGSRFPIHWIGAFA